MSIVGLEWFPANGDPPVLFTKAWPFKLQRLEGLASALAQGQSIKSPSQYGDTLVDIELPARIVSAQILVGAEDSADLWAKRRLLSRALSSTPARPREDVQVGVLRVYRGGTLAPLELQAIAQDSPKEGVRRAYTQVMDIEWKCPYPFPKEIADTFLHFETDEGGFEFEFESPFEIPSNNVEQEVHNAGDIDAPILARLFGEIDTARLLNLTTGEVIEVGGTVQEGEYVEINTEFGQKKIELVDTDTHERTSILDRLNLEKADFWSLRPGINIVRFEADSNVSGRAVVYWRQRYTGI